MANKRKTKTATAEARLPSEKVLRGLLRQSEKTKTATGDMAGAMSAAVRAAVEGSNLNPRAFRMIATLKRMDPVKLRGTLDHFDAYRDIVKLDDMKATDMFEEDKAPARKAARASKRKTAEPKGGEAGNGAAPNGSGNDNEADRAAA